LSFFDEGYRQPQKSFQHSFCIAQGETMATIILRVTGMKCGGCENQVQDAIRSCAGVASAKASHNTETVEINYDEAKTDLEAIRKAIKDKGFTIGA
jgi:copper chaperone